MLLDIPAVAATEGAVDSITWNATGTYDYSAGVAAAIIPGRFVSGTFSDNEDANQSNSGMSGEVRGAGQTASAGLQYLIVDSLDGSFNGKYDWVGDPSGAVFRPSGPPELPPWVFVYVDSLGQTPYIVRYGDVIYDSIENTITLRRNPKQGSTIKVLTCVLPTFTIPEHCSSWSLKNVSGALAYFRRFAPNVEGNVIDTVAKTFGEASIVGSQIENNQTVGFPCNDFSQGTSYIMCATASASSGAIVDFYP